MSYVFLLIFAAVPMASLIFIFGGVSLRDMVKALVSWWRSPSPWGCSACSCQPCSRRTSRRHGRQLPGRGGFNRGAGRRLRGGGHPARAEPPRWILVINPLSALLSAISPSTTLSGGALNFLWYLGMGLGAA